MARTQRAALNDDIIRWARHLRDACGDGLGLAANTEAYECWVELSRVLDEYDGLEPGSYDVVRHTANVPGTETQHIAAELAKVSNVSLRWRLLVQYRIRASFGDNLDGLTTAELERITKRTHQSVSSAVNFLRTAGWIHVIGQRLTPSGCPADIYALTPAGLRAFDERNTTP